MAIGDMNGAQWALNLNQLEPAKDGNVARPITSIGIQCKAGDCEDSTLAKKSEGTVHVIRGKAVLQSGGANLQAMSILDTEMA